MVDFEDQTVAVTGGGRGIGREACLQFAECGADVVVNDIGGDSSGAGADKRLADAVVEKIEAVGGTATADYGDISNWKGAAGIVETALETFGELDIVYNNLASFRRTPSST